MSAAHAPTKRRTASFGSRNRRYRGWEEVMELGKKGVFWFTDTLSPVQLIELARRTEELGYAVLWYPEALSYECFSLGSFLLANSKRLNIGSGIANIYARD